LHANPISNILAVDAAYRCPDNFAEMPIGNWKGNHPGCNCYQLTKTCSKACDIRVERHNITKMLLWKQKRFCVEEIKQWSFNRNGACPENYISDSNTPYCIKSA